MLQNEHIGGTRIFQVIFKTDMCDVRYENRSQGQDIVLLIFESIYHDTHYEHFLAGGCKYINNKTKERIMTCYFQLITITCMYKQCKPARE